MIASDMSTRADFLYEIEAFLRETLMSEGTFGQRAVADRGFVNSMRKGRVPMVDTVDKVRRFMADERARRKRRKKKARRAEAAAAI